MKLKKGQILYIDNEKYTVFNMIEYKEDTWIWQEYEIVNEGNKHRWLSVEVGENNQTEYYIYDGYTGMVNINEIEFQANNQVYELYEKGKAVVKDYFGNADVDKYEICEYFDYMSKDKKTIISVEKWDGETEKSIGYYLENSRLRITDEIDKSKISRSSEKSNFVINMIAIIFCVIPILAGIIPAVISSNASQSISKYLNNESTKYTYVTSVTNNTKNKKAKVYKSSFSDIDSTVKDIIDGVPTGITNTIDTDPDTEEDGIGLQTKKEYAYVYLEDDEVYVQVSSKSYMNNSGSMYHSRHYKNYYNSYSSTRESSTYSDYAYSARQNSINSRTSSGGGTSSGK